MWHSKESTRKKVFIFFISFLVIFTMLLSLLSEYDLRSHKWMYLYVLDLPNKYQTLRTQHSKPLHIWQPGPEYTLVDPVENYLKKNTGGKTVRTRGFHQILHYNEEVNNHAHKDNKVIKDTCAYQNCRFTNDRALMYNSTAVIFSLSHGKTPLDTRLPEKLPGQVWIYYDREPPIINSKFNYRHKSWNNAMNWSWSYRLDSDIVYPYGKFSSKRPEEIPIKDYSSIYKAKNKFAFAVISNCQGMVFSSRFEYIAELRKYIPLDIYGSCGSGKISYKQLFQYLKEYKYYLSLENSFCKEYVTEKFFERYNEDIILVTRGGADYSRMFPSGSFIEASSYDNPATLVEYLLRVSNDEELYTSFLKKKDRYEVDETLNWQCQMCAKLNHKERYARVYESVVSFWNIDMCWRATDVPTDWSNFYISVTSLFIVIVLIKYVWYRYSTRSQSGNGLFKWQTSKKRDVRHF